MNWKRMSILWRKELIGALRDRKTMMMLVIMTLLYYPLLTVGIGLFTKTQMEQVNAQIPVIVVMDAAGSTTSSIATEVSSVLTQNHDFRLAAAEDPEQALRDRTIQGIAKVTSNPAGSFQNVAIDYEYDPRYNVSAHSLDKLNQLAAKLTQEQIVQRLTAKGIDLSILTPYQVRAVEAPGTHSDAAMVLSFVPYLLVIGLVAGGMGLAMDITAGEKERGTIATLLVSQLSRTEIAVAKISTTLSLSVVSIILTVISLLITQRLLQAIMGGGGAIAVPFTLSDVLDLTVILLPLAFLLTALLILVGTYARSNKEGSLYAMPIIVLVIIAGAAGGSLDSSINVATYAVPFLGPLIAIKTLLLHVNNAWNAAGLAAVTTLIYAVIAIWFVVRIYSREEVLFRA
ncbi:MAG: ABC-type Na+ efflux pump, permease component [Bacilli bacterium]|nr:ABC-type Na+ efflux pump, permease component [Bacilli bacterium]